MSREEFLHRWDRMPELKFAELIDGVVYLPAPVSLEHGRFDSLIQFWGNCFVAQCPYCEVVANSTWLMLEGAPQPDLALRILPEHGGRSTTKGKFGSGAPELIAEVALSSRSYDLGPKMALYQRAGVREYVALLLEPCRIEWRFLRDGRYQLLRETDGVLQSKAFPGLWLDVEAFWSNDRKRLMATLRKGMKSPEFAAFLQRLKAKS